MITCHYGMTLVTGPASEPVTRAEAKLAARIDSTSEETLIDALITAAREQVESDTDRKLMPQTWLLTLDGFDGRDCPIEIPTAPVTGVTIAYDDVDDAAQTLDPELYYALLHYVPARVYPAPSAVWPVTSLQRGAVRVTFTAGYANAAAVPARAKQAIKMLVGHWYQNRELATDRQTKGVELAYERLIAGLRPGMI